MDSIIKNIGGIYIQLFSKNLFNTFCNAFDKVDYETKGALVHLWQTWKDSNLFTPQLLQKIEIRMNTILEQKAGGRLFFHSNPSFVRSSLDITTNKPPFSGRIEVRFFSKKKTNVSRDSEVSFYLRDPQ
jgi:intein-encoded DNA endonuclease-like protein